MVHGRYGTAASETLYVSGWGTDHHQLWGLGGNDTLYGWTQQNQNIATNDVLYGDRVPHPGDIQYNPNTTPPGVPGDDIIYGGGGHDTLYGDGGNDFLVGDKLFAGWSDPIGNDKLYGGDGNDSLYGGYGNDSLDGGNNNDFLSGTFSGSSSDRDTLTGGYGADTFSLGYNGRFSSYIDYLGSGYAILTDFKSWEGDKIRIGGSISDYTLNKSQNLSGTSELDTAIYRYGDLIAVVQDTTNVYTSNFI